MNNKKNIRHLYSMVLSIILCFNAHAQNDTMVLYKEFMEVSRNYQQQPLQTTVVLQRTSNFIQSAEDSTSIKGIFFLDKGMSYIRFGDLEQIVTDSLVLFVSDQLKRFSLMANSPAFMKNGGLSMLPASSKASYEAMAKKYTAEKVNISDKETIIRLSARYQFPETETPIETMEIKYLNSTKQPVSVNTVQRRLVAIGTDSANLNTAALAKFKIQITGKGNYLIKEKIEQYIFESISHNAAVKPPVLLSDRLTRNAGGEYIPAKGYEGYTISTR